MRSIILATAAALIVPSMAPAQAPSAPTCAHGALARIRLSKIKPGGSMAGFRNAVTAHTRWYQSHGFAIAQQAAPVLVYANGKVQPSANEVMTISTGDDVPRAKHDAGWSAFVAQYRANSEVEKEAIVCMSGSRGPFAATMLENRPERSQPRQ